jgi:two-component system, NarL family, nitrate/nitrite response regulator NarL
MILLASPSQSLCRRWRNALAGNYPLHQVNDRQTLISSLRDLQPSLLFFDHTDHYFGSTRLVCKLIKSVSVTKFVILAKDTRSTEAVEFIRAGAKGYCTTTIEATLICKAARVVASGEIWIGRKLLPVLFDEFVRTANTTPLLREPTVPNTFLGLSPREREITSLVACGQQNKFISNKLQISEKTVKAHLTTIFRKLGVDGRTQLALAVTGAHRQITTASHFAGTKAL